MPASPAVTQDPAAGAAVPGGGMIVPFTRAATEINEPTELDRTVAISASTQQLGPTDVPARGYLASLVLLVEATGGTGSAAVYEEDAPWSVIDNVALTDVNGGSIVGPFTGWDLYLMNLLGGYGAFDDPVISPAYSAPTTAGNFSFLVRIPVQINNRDGVGSLGNQDASQTYKLHTTLAAKSAVYSTDPTGLPNVRVRGWLEGWSAPSPSNSLGMAQALQPPAHGTTQNWSKDIVNVSAGEQNVKLGRVGNLIRCQVFTFRTTAPARSTTDLPQTLRYRWDARDVFTEDRILRLDYMKRRYGIGTLPDGVLAYDWMHDFDGRAGHEMRDGYLPTTGSTRLQLNGVFGAAGTLDILTCDVIPQGDIYTAG